MIYNKVLKQRYVDENSPRNKHLAYTMDYYFRRSADRETELDKDLSQFTVSEILALYKSYLSGSMETLMVINSQYIKYTTWCIQEGLVPDCQNHYVEITYDMLLSCLNTGLVKSREMTREELLDLIGGFRNHMDKVCYLALFEGICGPEFQELYNIRLSDVEDPFGKCILHVKSDAGERELAISPELYREISYASEEVELVTDRPITNNARYTTPEIILPLINVDDRVFKDRVSIIYDSPHSRLTRIQRIIKNMKDRSGRPELTAKSLMEYGRIHMIKEMMKKQGVELEDCIRNVDNRKMIEYRYGRIPSIPRYIQKYGKCFDTESH